MCCVTPSSTVFMVPGILALQAAGPAVASIMSQLCVGEASPLCIVDHRCSCHGLPLQGFVDCK